MPGTFRCYSKTFGEFSNSTTTATFGYPTGCSLSYNDMDTNHPYCVHMSQCGEYYSLECDMATRGEKNCKYPGTGNCYAETWGGEKWTSDDACTMYWVDGAASYDACDKCGGGNEGIISTYSVVTLGSTVSFLNVGLFSEYIML